MIVSVHQPHYLPWLGYFDKIDAADVFWVLDNVQFEKNGWQNRNKIKTADGWMWMTVPVSVPFGGTIADTVIADNTKWRRKHLQALVTNYARAPYFQEYRHLFETVYSRGWDRLSELNIAMLRHFVDCIGLGTDILIASDIGGLPDDPSERLARLVLEAGGDTYLAGAGSRSYLKEEPFRNAGIRIVFQTYEPAPYPQLFDGWIPGLAVVDALFNCGAGTLDVIRSGRRTEL